MSELAILRENVRRLTEMRKKQRTTEPEEVLQEEEEEEAPEEGYRIEKDPVISKMLKGPNDDFIQRARRYALVPRRSTEDHVPNMSMVLPTEDSKTDWKDKELNDLSIVMLGGKKNHDEIVTLGQEAFGSIHGTLTKKAVAILLILSYNLRDEGDRWLMSDFDEDLVNAGNSLAYDELNAMSLNISASRDIEKNLRENDPELNEASRLQMLATGYCYLAASYLRMFTKDIKNFTAIGNHLKDKFTNFYSFQFPFEDFHPDASTIKAIRKQFELDQCFKNTLYVILYSSCKNKEGDNIEDFLFRIHLNFTGLHSFTLYLRAMDSLKVSNKMLANAMFNPAYQSQLDGVARLFQLDTLRDKDHELKMWRFGRIFNKDFMKMLQTKNCVLFALVLAFILRETTSVNRDGPLQIIHLEKASIENQREAYGIALRTVMLLKKESGGVEHTDAATLRV